MYCKVRSTYAIHPLGFSIEAIFRAIQSGETAVREIKRPYLQHQAFAALFSEKQNEQINESCPKKDWTRFEKLLWNAATSVLNQISLPAEANDLLFVIATTKGSIEEIGNLPPEGLCIAHSVNKVLQKLRARHLPLIISNACISGLSAIVAGANLLQNSAYRYAAVIGVDTINDFVLSGFNSLMALSPEICRPFDRDRKGINMGEAAAAIILEKCATLGPEDIYYTGGAVTNDANHISGSSRTGEELAYAIGKAIQQSNLQSVDFVSAHGTGTLYNDEMESKAFTLAGLSDIPVHSLKAYLGHTLGAAGVLESAICIQMLHKDVLIPSKGYQIQGTSQPLNIQEQLAKRPLNSILKTMSGFGGSNAAVCFRKTINEDDRNFKP